MGIAVSIKAALGYSTVRARRLLGRRLAWSWSRVATEHFGLFLRTRPTQDHDRERFIKMKFHMAAWPATTAVFIDNANDPSTIRYGR